MVDKLKKILKEIKSNKGAVTVFAILKMDELTEKWSVVFSAPWVSESNLTDTFNYLRGLLLKELDSEEVLTIARLSVYVNGEHLIQLITGAVSITDGDFVLKNSQLNGYEIHEAHIFESTRN